MDCLIVAPESIFRTVFPAGWQCPCLENCWADVHASPAFLKDPSLLPNNHQLFRWELWSVVRLQLLCSMVIPDSRLVGPPWGLGSA